MSGKIALGWDIHRKFSQVSIVERDDNCEIRVVERMRLDHADRPGMESALRKVPAGTPVAMEGAFGWPWIADMLEMLDLEPHLGHPPAIRVLANDSADRHGRRHIAAACNHTLRWAFIEAAGGALHSKNTPPHMRRLYERLSRGGHAQAKVAVARELCILVYVIWKKGEPYRDPTHVQPGKAKRRTARSAPGGK